MLCKNALGFSLEAVSRCWGGFCPGFRERNPG